MGVVIGKTTKLSVNVDLQYYCSKCGTANTIEQTITKSGSGSSYSDESRINARDELQQTLKELCRHNVANRYLTAGFNCRCANCHHKEPWAMMRYGIFSLFAWISGFILFFWFFNKAATPSLDFPLIFVTIFAFSVVFPKVHKRHMQNKIKVLSERAIPRIFMKRNDGVVVELLPPVMSPENSWECASCGEINPNHQAYCSCCNSTKAWSLTKNR